MAGKLSKKIFLVTLMTLFMLTYCSFADSVSPSTDEDSDISVSDEEDSHITVSEEDVMEQLQKAQNIVNDEERAQFEAEWNAMTAQEKHDYLLPILLEDLNTLYTKLLIAESDVMAGKDLEMGFLQFYDRDLAEFREKTFIISNVADYKYSAYKPLVLAHDELHTLARLVDQQYVATKTSLSFANSNDDGSVENDYDKHTQYFNEFYAQAYEISLMRDYGIEVDSSVDRALQEIAEAHKGNLARYKIVMDNIQKCADVFGRGDTDSDLYAKVKNAKFSLYVSLSSKDTYNFMTHTQHPDDTITPLAYRVVDGIQAAADATGDFMVYALIGEPERGKAKLDESIAKANELMTKFEAKCNEFGQKSDAIDKNIFETITMIKADRQKTAESNGYASWEAYQIHLDALAQAEYDAKVNEKATELAVEQKKWEEEVRKAQEEAEAEWQANKLDFSKPLSQQNHLKSYYMDMALSKIESNPILADVAPSVLQLESIAFDELFRIRANGGDIKLLQDLYDDNPNAFTRILSLYRAFK